MRKPNTLFAISLLLTCAACDPTEIVLECTREDHCQLVNGEPQCESGYMWANEDRESGDFTCIEVSDEVCRCDTSAECDGCDCDPDCAPPNDGGVDSDSDSGHRDEPDGNPDDLCDGQCQDQLYSACTCDPSDPCSWSENGRCDLPPDGGCTAYEAHFDDENDCRDPCNDLCEEGETRCVVDVLQTCEADETGCLSWSRGSPCEDGFCADNHSCGECRDLCTERGQTVCHDGEIRRCEADFHGCLDWSTTRCSEGYCDDDFTCGNCALICESGGSRCRSDELSTCRINSQGCLDWSEFQPCPDGFCIDGERCGECHNDCEHVDFSQCVDGEVRRCEEDQNACLHWTAFEPCEDGFCADVETCGSCDAEECQDPGETRCRSGRLTTCELDPRGCLRWGEEEHCSNDLCTTSTSCTICELGQCVNGDGCCVESCHANSDTDCAEPCDGDCRDGYTGTWRNPSPDPEELWVLALKADDSLVGIYGSQEVSGTYQVERDYLNLQMGARRLRYRQTRDDDELHLVAVDDEGSPLSPTITFQMLRTLPGFCFEADDCSKQPLPFPPQPGEWECSPERLCFFRLSDVCEEIPATEETYPISTTGAPPARTSHEAVWTGVEMIIWGGRQSETIVGDGMRYDPLTDTWTPISSTNAPTPRVGHVTLWTGTHMVVFGGVNGEERFHDGGLYDPREDVWDRIDECTDCDGLTYFTEAYWTGEEILFWSNAKDGGVLYDPSSESWTRIESPGLYWETAGVTTVEGEVTAFSNGRLYAYYTCVNDYYGGVSDRLRAFDLETWEWIDRSDEFGPYAYPFGTLIDDDRLIAFQPIRLRYGTIGGTRSQLTGATYDFLSDTWHSIPRGPDERYEGDVVWTGRDIVICRSHYYSSDPYETWCVRYNPNTRVWSSSVRVSESSLSGATMVWAGDRLIVWGGRASSEISGMVFSDQTNEGTAWLMPTCQ